MTAEQRIINNMMDLIEQAVVRLALSQPAWGPMRVSGELQKHSLFISPSGIRRIWLRHDLQTSKLRLEALEAKTTQEELSLPEGRIIVPEQAQDRREVHSGIETGHPGYLGSQDTFYVGTLKGVGRVYQQTCIDTYSRVTLAKLYDCKNALATADMLSDRVLPSFEVYDIPLYRIFTDRGTGYCGPRERHDYELYLAVEDIDHLKTKAHNPQCNGICERFHNTRLKEFYRTAFRKRTYQNLDELQVDLDTWLKQYNESRLHSEKYCFGTCPIHTFLDGLPLAKDTALHLTVQTTADLA